MYKKLDENNVTAILEAGIRVFAKYGLDRAGIKDIAATAGVSVGVIYKYFESKENFFLSCVKYALKSLDEVLDRTLMSEDSLEDTLRNIVMALMHHVRSHPNHNALYHEITSGSCRDYSVVMAHEIESRSAKVYAAMMEKLSKSYPEADLPNPRLFAFFFDNLLMMLQFSYSCDYYRERMLLFCGEDLMKDDETVANELVRFLIGAFGLK